MVCMVTVASISAVAAPDSLLSLVSHQVKHSEPPTVPPPPLPLPLSFLPPSLHGRQPPPSESLIPARPNLPNPIRQLPLAPPLPHGGPKARPLTAIGCPGLHGALAPLAPPTAPAPGEREGLGWCQHRRGPLGLLPAPGDGGGGRRGGRRVGAGAQSGKRSSSRRRRRRKRSDGYSFTGSTGSDGVALLLTIVPVTGGTDGRDGDDTIGSGQRHLPGREREQPREPPAAAV